MAEPRTRRSSAQDLLLGLSSDSAVPLWGQLRRALLDGISAGRLHPGDRLPSTRVLADDLGVSRSVVVDAYSQLVAEGHLTAQQGSGTRVAASAGPLGQSGGTAQRRAHQPAAYDLRPGPPDLSSFPRAAWQGALTRVLRELPDSQLGYVAPLGVSELRDQLAAHLGRTRGVVTTGRDVLVTVGATQAFAIAAGALAQQGHATLALEDPNSPPQRHALERLGVLRLLPVPVDDQGLQIGALAASGARAVIVNPPHQVPLGATLSPARREALVGWAQRTGGHIIESDHVPEFRYDDERLPALQSLDPARVSYVGSASTTLAPALRLGWLVPGEQLREAAVRVKRHTDVGTGTFDQHALALLLADGTYARHVRKMQAVYRRRRDATLGALQRWLPDWQVQGQRAGLHLWLTPPRELDETAVVMAAADRGVLLMGGASTWSTGSSPRAHLVVGYARLSEERLEHAVALLAGAVTDLLADLPQEPGVGARQVVREEW